jgi:hypothetical protein
MYAMVGSRPDIAFAQSVVSRYMSKPSHEHWLLVKKLLRYLQGTRDLCLRYSADFENGLTLYGYSDADWAGDKIDRHSTTGYIFFLAGAPVTWAAKKQPTVALSSTEAEYMAVTQACKEAIWLRRLLTDLGYNQEAPTIIYEDNQGCIELARNPVHHSRTKHIDIQWHFIREKLESQEIQLKYCETANMVADICTKALPRVKFRHLRDLMGLTSIVG